MAPSEVMFGLRKGRKLHDVTTDKFIWANQKTESFMYRWICVHATFDLTCIPAFVEASDSHFKHSVDTLIDLLINQSPHFIDYSIYM